MNLALFVRVGHFQRQQFSLGKDRLTVRIDQVGLEPADHDALQLAFFRHHVSSETLIV